MASYRNPYATQSTQINSIANNLADAFLPNSAGATNANLYNMRAQRYADLATKSQLDADKTRLENQQTIFEAEQNRRLRDAFSPNIAGLFGLDPNDPNAMQTATDLAGLLQGDKGLVPALLADRVRAGQQGGLTAAQLNDIGRLGQLVQGKAPGMDFAATEGGADLVADRKARQAINTYAGKNPAYIDRQNTLFGLRGNLQDRKAADQLERLERRLDVTERGQDIRSSDSRYGVDTRSADSRYGVDTRDATSRRGQDMSAEGRQEKMAFDQSKYTPQDVKVVNGFLDVLEPLDKNNVPQPITFTGDSDVDFGMHNFINTQFLGKYNQARGEGKSPTEARRIASNGLSTGNLGKTREYSTGFFGDSIDFPLYIFNDIKSTMPQVQAANPQNPTAGLSFAQQALQSFGITGDLQNLIIDDLNK